MAKTKDAIINGTYFQESVYRDEEERAQLVRQLLKDPKETVTNWYKEYIEKRAALAEVEDLTNEWQENQLQEC